MRKAGKVGVDELLSDLRRHGDVLGERVRPLAVQHRVVDHLGLCAELVWIAAAVGAEDLQRGLRVEIGALPKRIDQNLVAGHVRQDAELDLRVVG